MRTTTARVLALAAASLLLGGCGLFGGDDTEPAPAPEPVAGATDAPGGGELELVVARLQAQAGQDAEPVEVAEELPVIATRAGSALSGNFALDLNGVLVEGELMTVVFTVRSAAEGLLTISDTFDDGVAQPHPDDGGTAGPPNRLSTDGVYVLDAVNARRHLAAYDTTGRCVCSASLNGASMDPGGQLVLATTFTAPPDDVDTVEVGIPTVGVFSNVPVTR